VRPDLPDHFSPEIDALLPRFEELGQIVEQEVLADLDVHLSVNVADYIDLYYQLLPSRRLSTPHVQLLILLFGRAFGPVLLGSVFPLLLNIIDAFPSTATDNLDPVIVGKCAVFAPLLCVTCFAKQFSSLFQVMSMRSMRSGSAALVWTCQEFTNACIDYGPVTSLPHIASFLLSARAGPGLSDTEIKALTAMGWALVFRFVGSNELFPQMDSVFSLFRSFTFPDDEMKSQLHGIFLGYVQLTFTQFTSSTDLYRTLNMIRYLWNRTEWVGLLEDNGLLRSICAIASPDGVYQFRIQRRARLIFFEVVIFDVAAILGMIAPEDILSICSSAAGRCMSDDPRSEELFLALCALAIVARLYRLEGQEASLIAVLDECRVLDGFDDEGIFHDDQLGTLAVWHRLVDSLPD
jgi:hypothetical protein